MTRWHSPPAELYALVESTPATVLLESAAPPANSGSAICFAPTRLFTAPQRVLAANSPADLPGLFAAIESAVDSGLCAAGYFSYECRAFFEPTAGPASEPSVPSPAQPLAWFGLYDSPHVFDHQTGRFLGDVPPALARFHTAHDASADPDPDPDHNPHPEQGQGPACDLALTLPQYAERIEQIHALIRSGDVYQLNFTIPIRINVPGSPAALYRRLHARQPAPYGAFLHTQPGQRILSFSPELFFRLDSGMGGKSPVRRITTRPMKGTAPRGRTTQEDREQAEWLANDPKNRAENVMIVDLLRNDLSRICTFGSVRVENLFAAERYPTLWQMTSTVTGQLRPEAGFRQIFRALFPCGSVTGAPKVRAMQLLSGLEREPRGIYTGAIGFFSRQQSIFNVAIRTLPLQGDPPAQTGTMGVGSGIVIDSVPADEWRECLLKASFLTRGALPPAESFSLVETLLWQGGNPLLELHLDRLEDSARYFDFPFKRAEVKAALEAQRLLAHAPSPWETPRKARLLLNCHGSLHITSEPIAEPSGLPLRVRIAVERTDRQDPMYFHKTTHRPLYARALRAATEAGYDEVLFLNQQGEVTEAAIHNVFLEMGGRLLTPPIASGVLPGVRRRHILATRGDAEERVVTVDDLRRADALYLSNAVRGLCRAFVDWEAV